MLADTSGNGVRTGCQAGSWLWPQCWLHSSSARAGSDLDRKACGTRRAQLIPCRTGLSAAPQQQGQQLPPSLRVLGTPTACSHQPCLHQRSTRRFRTCPNNSCQEGLIQLSSFSPTCPGASQRPPIPASAAEGEGERLWDLHPRSCPWGSAGKLPEPGQDPSSCQAMSPRQGEAWEAPGTGSICPIRGRMGFSKEFQAFVQHTKALDLFS